MKITINAIQDGARWDVLEEEHEVSAEDAAALGIAQFHFDVTMPTTRSLIVVNDAVIGHGLKRDAVTGSPSPTSRSYAYCLHFAEQHVTRVVAPDPYGAASPTFAYFEDGLPQPLLDALVYRLSPSSSVPRDKKAAIREELKKRAQAKTEKPNPSQQKSG